VDETDLRLFPPLRARWAERGKPAPLPISGANAKRVVFDTLHLRTGMRLFLARDRQLGLDFGRRRWVGKRTCPGLTDRSPIGFERRQSVNSVAPRTLRLFV
jgi:hypothetical protein